VREHGESFPKTRPRNLSRRQALSYALHEQTLCNLHFNLSVLIFGEMSKDAPDSSLAYDAYFTIIVLGNLGVGKSQLVKTLVGRDTREGNREVSFEGKIFLA
jgi:putative ribosome biogenesis GTPase RsgA